MLKLENVSKTFDRVVALHPTDLNLAVAKTTVLIGPSGCGKSTLLRLMINLIESDTGNVLFNNATFTAQDMLELRRRMGYVIQDGGLFPHLSARVEQESA